MAFSKAMPEAFPVTFFNGNRDNDEVKKPRVFLRGVLNASNFFTSSLSRLPLKNVTRKASGMPLLKAIFKFCTANKLFNVISNIEKCFSH